MKIALLCGGPSLERGISLNSARSVLDHLGGDQFEIVPIYFDLKKSAYKISKNQLYSNTPSDFDFKLHNEAKPLSKKLLVKLLKKIDIAFPAIHGTMGDDGEIQNFLEKNNIPFIGSSSLACRKIFDKYKANCFLKNLGFYTLPSALLKIYHTDHEQIINEFFSKNNLKRAIVKPACGGSSIGVFSVSTPQEALEKVNLIFSKRMDTRVVLEPFAEGREFTVIILQNKFHMPVAILPTEIEADYTKHQIFDYRKKYLPTRQVTYHCPPRFSNEIIEEIQVKAEQLFNAIGMSDFARFDGWVLNDGNIWFSDFNPISGMEQNSFLFQQSSRVGLSHSEVLKYVLKHACSRQRIKYPNEPFDPLRQSFSEASKLRVKPKKEINILFGGSTAERQVSLMSGTNVWLKLRQSKIYSPKPFLLDLENNVWSLPYPLTLNHTVEEIIDNCVKFKDSEERLSFLEKKVQLRLCLETATNVEFFAPFKMTLAEFINKSKIIFNALHGGFGEDGTLQKILDKKDIIYNGPGAKASALCIDKFLTSKFISSLRINGIRTSSNFIIELQKIILFNDNELKLFWRNLQKKLNSKTIIIKPSADGCSAGVARLFSVNDLQKYIYYLKNKKTCIPSNTLLNQVNIIEMPLHLPKNLLLEEFIATDNVKVKGNKLKHNKKTGWLEVTIGIIENNKQIIAFNPSITIAEGGVLTVEEKFQGGTGINITPPPKEIISKKAVNRAKKLIVLLAKNLGLNGYSRIDAFINVKSGDLIIIEINTLPGLTPSTVFFHQALAEEPPLSPRELIEKIISNKIDRPKKEK